MANPVPPSRGLSSRYRILPKMFQRTDYEALNDNPDAQLVSELQLKAIKLDWVNFQVMRRTHASLSLKAGIDTKLVADQLGHGLGINLDVYTISDLGPSF